ncbi:MAG: hypothetical protein ACYCW6_30790 [Candidatus Xenobia bacterium]
MSAQAEHQGLVAPPRGVIEHVAILQAATVEAGQGHAVAGFSSGSNHQILNAQTIRQHAFQGVAGAAPEAGTSSASPPHCLR